ncbi:MAG: HD-GYP domain-containing protein, partial [Deltaproteobacteria bacterium]|nr:HD-GYP domain-containing protein [Deltaproteobacteria bacterium]
VMENSTVMMKNFMDQRPVTAINIENVKTAVNEIVDLILKEDETTYYLINITDHDYSTYTHSVNVGMLGIALAKEMFRNTPEHDIHALGVGFFLHDLGKVKINPDIITKQGKLTEEEMGEMRSHPAQGYKILFETKQLTRESKLIVLQHHERNNGKGYPRGLRGDEIHLYGRLCTVVDVYDALTSERPYKKKMDPFHALKIMREEMIDHFQMDLFEKFVRMFRAP